MLNSVMFGKIIKKTRNNLKLTQRDLALASGTGQRFIIEIEKGKETCQIGKILTVLNSLGIKIEFILPNNEK